MEDLGAQYVLDLLHKFDLPVETMLELFDYCKEQGIKPLCTPWDIQSLDILENYGMEAYKIASADLTNLPLLARAAKTGKMIYFSTGMSNESEIIQTVEFLKSHNARFTALHCNSTYPTPYKDVNLAYMATLKSLTGADVGYSGHERGYHIPIAATALGACVIEKHITLCREWEGNDHKVSLLPAEFAEMVKSINDVVIAIGNSGKRIMTSGERINRDNLAKSIVAARDLKMGDVISLKDVCFKGPGGGLQPNRISDIVGRTLTRGVHKSEFINLSDISQYASFHSFSLQNRWGIPVRPHDWKEYRDICNADLLEFHISYNDISLDVGQYLEHTDLDFTLHSPDLFEGDHLIDIGCTNQFYRIQSAYNLQRVINLAKKMRPYFTTTDRTKIIASVGGISRDGFIDEKSKQAGYDFVRHHLEELKDDEVEIIIQTVPPMPWYFGGQLYLNLFVLPDEIAKFCSETGFRICFDVSHSMMACNKYDLDFYEFARTVKPYIAHLHLSDAKSVDGEGLQIGEGEIDFKRLASIIGDCGASLIPEIWQGHHDRGRECWKALAILEEWF